MLVYSTKSFFRLFKPVVSVYHKVLYEIRQSQNIETIKAQSLIRKNNFLHSVVHTIKRYEK